MTQGARHLVAPRRSGGTVAVMTDPPPSFPSPNSVEPSGAPRLRRPLLDRSDWAAFGFAALMVTVLAAILWSASSRADAPVSEERFSEEELSFAEELRRDVLVPMWGGGAVGRAHAVGVEARFGELEAVVVGAARAACESMTLARAQRLDAAEWARQSHRQLRLTLPSELAEIHVATSLSAPRLCVEHAEWLEAADWGPDRNPFVPTGGYVSP